MTDELSRASRDVLAQVSAAAAPSASDKARGWAQLQAQIPTDLGPLQPASLAGPAHVGAKSVALLKWVAAAALALGGGGVWWASAPVQKPTVSVAPARLAPTATVAPEAPGTMTTQPVQATPVPRLPEASRAARPAPSLAAEAELLHLARLALQGGNNAVARQKLSEHARLYPRSQLRAARSLLQVKLLCAEGNLSAARAEANRLRGFAVGSSETTGLSGTCVGR